MELNVKLLDRLGSCVREGPFSGLNLTAMTQREHLGPFLLGTYESELHSWWRVLLKRTYSQVWDVGAKFGYYAVGIARLMPTTPVLAFDTDWWARAATRQMAEMNGATNLRVIGYCSQRWLDRHLTPGSLIVSDCEGFEADLFSGATTRALDSATLLIEIHDHVIPGIGEIVRQRFAATHDVSTVSTGLKASTSVDLSFLTPEESASALTEIRPPQEWLLFEPKDAHNARPGTIPVGRGAIPTPGRHGRWSRGS